MSHGREPNLRPPKKGGFGHVLAPHHPKSSSKNSRNSRNVDDDDLDTLSNVSNDSFTDESSVDTLAETPEQLMHTNIELLTEKRAAIRTNAYQALIEIFSNAYSPDLHESLSSHVETLCTYCLNSIRKGDKDEVELAGQTLSLVIIVMEGHLEESLYQKFEATLTEISKNNGKSVHVRAAAILCLSMIAFLTSEDPNAQTRVMEVCVSIGQAVGSNGNEVIGAATWEAWSLCGCALPIHILSAQLKPALTYLLRGLSHSSTQVRVAAGEAIALAHNAHREYLISHRDASDADKEALRQDGLNSAIYEGITAAVKNTVANVSMDTTHHTARKDRVRQRASFREILDSITHGIEPSETITIGKFKHDVEGWTGIITLNALRGVLGTGLPVHGRSNPLICGMFGWDIVPSVETNEQRQHRLDQIALSRSKEKEQYQYERKERQKKLAHTMHHDD